MSPKTARRKFKSRRGNGGGMVVPRGTGRPCQKSRKHGPAGHKGHGRAMWHGHAVPFGCLGHLCPSSWLARATWVWCRGTSVQHSFATFLAFLAFLSAKCYSSFRFFDKVPENIERCYMSKKYAKGDRFDSSLTRSNVNTIKREKCGKKWVK